MIIMPERLQELMDELKVANAETFYHSIHVKTYVMTMMKHMSADGILSYTQSEKEAILKGALLHDLGKLYVKNVILTKDSYLTDEERGFMTEHTRMGFEAVESSLTEEEYDIVKNICLYHHDRIDGNGYNRKTDLPLYVQIVSLCDTYDALTSDRVYRDALEPEVAIEIIGDGACGCFDEQLLKYLWKLVD